jgi:hypothetical protein
MKAQRVSGGKLYSFFNLGAICNLVINVRPRPFYPRERDQTSTVLEASGPVWAGVESFAATGIRSPNRPVRRESLYRLRYSDPYFHMY